MIIILSIGERFYTKQLQKDTGREWKTAKDRMVLKEMVQLLKPRLKGSFVLSQAIQEDSFQLIRLMDKYCDGNTKLDNQIQFKFSLKRLLLISFLAFEEIYESIKLHPMFKFLQYRKIIWFDRFIGYGQFYSSLIGKIPFIKSLSKSPLPGFIIRLLLTPLLGIPSLIWYNIRTFLIGFLSEGTFRFFYVITFMRIARYGLVLYGEPNPHIEEQMKKYDKEGLRKYYNKLDFEITIFDTTPKSTEYETAIIYYQDLLNQFNLHQDKQYQSMSKDKEWLDKISQFFNSDNTENNLKPFFHKLLHSIPNIYGYKKEKSYMHLRLGDYLRFGYRLSLQGIYYLITTPGLEQLSEVPINMMIKLQTITKKDIFTNIMPHAKSLYTHYKGYSKVQKLLKFITRKSGGLSLAWSVSSPIIIGHLRRYYTSFIAHRISRLWIMSWEENKQGKSPSFNLYYEGNNDEPT
ncbi:hypothetical protein [Spirochaeta cellobiosiphila]|uniref:hypothetical protein n=1 Tax=Spirochaeta cellobiosiphila TaxID=504483 RepID=UPI000422F1B5|nr:hypothetical protein [Spirochaeta cellobiosiphila]